MFKSVKVKLPGFKYPICEFRELTISQVIQAGKLEGGETDVFLFFVEKGLRNTAGDLVFNEQYTIEQFMDESPTSFIDILSKALEELNKLTSKDKLAAAKNS